MAATRARADTIGARTDAPGSAAPPARDDRPTTRLPSAATPGRGVGRRRIADRLTGLSTSLAPGRSLRGRLIVAFAAISFLTLILVGTGFLFIIRQYQEQRELLRLGTLIGPILVQARQADQVPGRTLEDAREVLDRLSDELNVRIVVARSPGVIVYDSAETLVSHRIDYQAAEPIGPQQRGRLVQAPGVDDRRLRFLFLQPGGDRQAPADRQTPPDRPAIRPGATVLAVVHEPPTVRSVLAEMAPRLGLAALLSLAASTVVAWLLAASIARPLARMTRAAEDMALGRFDQEIDARGTDEVARLSAAFNAMVREVARSHRTLRDFVANVSHDLRTPLTSIQGFSQAMVDGALRSPEEYADAGRVINEEAERMRRLVEDLLELSKIESGQVRLDLAPYDLRALAERAVERLARRAADEGVQLALAVDDAPLVRADSRWVERALDNLLDNALKHTPAGGTVTIAAGPLAVPSEARAPVPFARRGGEHGHLFGYLSVHNTGSFIPPSDQPRVFERFYQLDKARTASGSGSGLGLAIAQEIVQAHGGWIEVQSSRAGGTEFTVALPALDRPALDRLALDGPVRDGPVLDRGAGRPVGSPRTERDSAS